MQILILLYSVKTAIFIRVDRLYMTLYTNQMLIVSNKELSGWLGGGARRLRSARFSTFPSSD